MEKGPSTFDVRHVFSLSVIQVAAVRPRRILGAGEQESHARLAISEHHEHHERTAIHRVFGNSANGSGSGRHRPPGSGFDAAFLDKPADSRRLFWARREHNSFFSIPINVPGGSGSESTVRFGTLGRNTFRGPGFKQLDMALIKDTPFGHRGRANSASSNSARSFSTSSTS